MTRNPPSFKRGMSLRRRNRNHHIVAVEKDGLDDPENLAHLHKGCHKQVHSKTS
ncbi:MAG: hypothetical protein BRC53_12875 [Cyanobacteria bacterium SW_6_48_11]|nr:MAG: hypothetical protein BRC43_15475 [Cyanobacteria bacterium QS_3_48_167]PSO90929.1 MAG: hypothetical protein BRC46_12300 [Cyanobacteria bacterium QS_6_48_18]PSO94289.1 MAG: hypothetical protein BRC53_12875 [Cyanobacteria bacterium SW_6_48_11]